MNVRGLAVAMLCAAIPLSLSCAQSDDIGDPGAITPGVGSTGGSQSPTPGGSGGGISATGGQSATNGSTGGSTTTMGTGGSAGHPLGGTPEPGTGGSVVGTGGATSSTGGATPTATGGSSTGGATGGTSGRGTGGSSTGGTATGGSSTGGTATGGTMAGTGGRATGATGGTTGTTTGGSTGTTTGASAGTIVPLYTDPTDISWTAIATAALAHPKVQVVAIVNPSDGPGPSKDQDYVAGIASLLAANIKVIGYVATGYGSHSIASMEAQMDTWKSFYPNVQGIFFDEQSNDPTLVSHYQTLSQYAKSKGLNYTVGNPGTGVPTSYIGAVDTMLVYESDGLPSMSSLQAWSAYAPTNFGIIPYKVSAIDATFIKQAKQYIHYVYLQKDDLPNPWDSLTPYFADLLAALE
ncbi:MAG TPA: spherulation-specific family 4 protein [Polyangia bacterium]|nr:spherulation-specific family 4 protein [Polyangia bacterium]